VYLRIPVPEAHRYRLSIDDEVTFTTPGAPEGVHRARVSEIGQDASPLNGQQVFWVSARVDDPSPDLRPGMTGTARVDVPARGLGALLRGLRASL
jgi:multidrug efflux pump subunit AcrA (membrane-fusion protein)